MSLVRTRRGAILIWCAVAVMGVLGIAALWRSVATRELRHVSHDIELEWRFEALARSMVALMESEVRRLANTDGPLSEIFRHPTPRPDDTVIDVTWALDLRAANDWVARPEYDGFTVEKLETQVTRQAPLDVIPEEKTLLVIMRVTILLPVDRRTSRRTFEQARVVKVARTCPMPQVMEYGLFIADASGLTDLREANRLRDRFLELMTGLRRSIQERAGRAAGAERTAWEDLLKEAFDPDVPGAAPARVPEVDAFALYGLRREGATQDLARMDLAEEMQRIHRECEELKLRWDSGVIGEGTSLDLGHALSQEIMKGLWRIWAYQAAHKVLPATDSPEYQLVQKIAAVATPEFLQRRTQWILREEPGGVPVSRRFRELLGREGSTNGVFQVENEREPVVLRGRIPGRMMILAGPGGIVLDSVNERLAPGELVTVVARTGTVRVLGNTSAVVLLTSPGKGEAEPRLELGHDAQLSGSLVAVRRSYLGSLRGTLVRGGGPGLLPMLTGREVESVGLFAAVSPRVLYQRVIRG